MKNTLLLLFLFAYSGLAHSDQTSNSSARINGITQFLIERANETYFYIFERKMQKNEKFACYFPATYEYIKGGDLKALIKAADIWQETMQQDFETLRIRAIAHGLSEAIDFNKIAMSATDEYAELLGYLKIEINGKTHPLNMISLNMSQQERDIINGFYTDFNQFRDALRNFDRQLQQYKDPCSKTLPTKKLLSDDVQQLEHTYKNLDGWLNHIDRYKQDIRIDSTKVKNLCALDSSHKICSQQPQTLSKMAPKLKQSLEAPLVKTLASIPALYTFMHNIEKRKTFTSKTIEAFNIIKQQTLEDNQTLKKLKYYILFVAQVADADNPDQVDNLLREYALPAVSFLSKREPKTNHLFITSYFGYAAGSIQNDDTINSDNDNGFYIPIGFEYSRGLSNESSISIMLSPVDFGYPVGLKLNGETEDVKLDDIIAPSISIAYGIKDYPVNVGIAYQKGKKIELQSEEEERLLLFVAFDMPLFSF